MKHSTVSGVDADYDVAIHSEGSGPVLVYVSQPGAPIGAYVYTIGKNLDTYSTVLQHSADHGLQDMAANMGRVLVKKLQRPSYVCMSGVSVHEYGLISRAVLAACE